MQPKAYGTLSGNCLSEIQIFDRLAAFSVRGSQKKQRLTAEQSVISKNSDQMRIEQEHRVSNSNRRAETTEYKSEIIY